MGEDVVRWAVVEGCGDAFGVRKSFGRAVEMRVEVLAGSGRPSEDLWSSLWICLWRSKTLGRPVEMLVEMLVEIGRPSEDLWRCLWRSEDSRKTCGDACGDACGDRRSGGRPVEVRVESVVAIVVDAKDVGMSCGRCGCSRRP